MAANPNIDALIKKHQSQRRQEFMQPHFVEFENTYKCDVPSVLRELYSLESALLNTANQLDTASGPLWVESFCPLNLSMIKTCAEKYDRKFFQVASGGEGQAYLCCISDPEAVWVDYEGDGVDLEVIPVRLQDVVLAASAN